MEARPKLFLLNPTRFASQLCVRWCHLHTYIITFHVFGTQIIKTKTSSSKMMRSSTSVLNKKSTTTTIKQQEISVKPIQNCPIVCHLNKMPSTAHSLSLLFLNCTRSTWMLIGQLLNSFQNKTKISVQFNLKLPLPSMSFVCMIQKTICQRIFSMFCCYIYAMQLIDWI